MISHNHLSVQDAQNLTKLFMAQVQENQALRSQLRSQQETSSGLYEENFRARRDREDAMVILADTRKELEAARFEADATKSILNRRKSEEEPVNKEENRLTWKRFGLSVLAGSVLAGVPIGIWALVTQTAILG